jgi:hypothetical protein
MMQDPPTANVGGFVTGTKDLSVTPSNAVNPPISPFTAVAAKPGPASLSAH